MRIYNQKKGRMGQTLHHKYTGTKRSVSDLARIVSYILSRGGTEEHLLCEYFQTETWEAVQSSDIVAAVQGTEKLSNHRSK